MPRNWYFHLQLHSWLTPTAWSWCLPSRAPPGWEGRAGYVFVLNLYTMLMAFRGEKPTLNQVCTPPFVVSKPLGGSAVCARVFIYTHIMGASSFWGGVVNLGMFCSFCEATVMPRAEGRRRKMFQLWRARTIAASPWACAKLRSRGGVSAHMSLPALAFQTVQALPAFPSNLHLQCLSCTVTRGTKKPFADSPETKTTQDSSLFSASTLTHMPHPFFPTSQRSN